MQESVLLMCFFSNLVCVFVFMYFFYCVFGVLGVCLMCNLVSAAL